MSFRADERMNVQCVQALRLLEVYDAVGVNCPLGLGAATPSWYAIHFPWPWWAGTGNEGVWNREQKYTCLVNCGQGEARDVANVPRVNVWRICSWPLEVHTDHYG